MTTPRDDLLCWIDLEMTGLDPIQNVIVEIATLITDRDLNIVAEGPEIVAHASEEHLGRMVNIVKKMHEKSGLTERIRASTVNLADAEMETLVFLKEHVKERSAPVCGNSIWCDRMFMKLQMPKVDEWLHYRTIDVSSFKEVATRWGVQGIAGAPRKGDQHRALDDIRESIAELKHYRDNWLAPHRAPDAAEKAAEAKRAVAKAARAAKSPKSPESNGGNA
ncbi:MAG: oligoribonuclease [Planctomycetota bacterium]|nr:MAG: oligoribonuclease [Planctomycetota bacterium]